MNDNKLEETSKVFELNIEAFPKSSNVYDSYGEALAKLGTDISEYEKEFIVEDSVLKTYVGKFELMPNFIIIITKEGNQLKAQATG